MAYMQTADDILANAKLRAFYPTSGGVIADADIYTLMSDELLSIVTAQEMAAVQGHLAMEVVVPLVANQQRYTIPYRSAGAKLRYACLQSTTGDRTNIRFGRPERFVTTYNVNTAFQGTMPQNSWFEDGRICLYPIPTNATYSLVLGVYIRPSRLIPAASASTVSSATSAGASSIACSALPAAFNGATSIDILSFHTPYQVKAYNMQVSSMSTGATSITVSGSTSVSYNNVGLSYSLDAGDYICLPEQTPVAQVPNEMWPLLAARTAKRILQARGDAANLQIVDADIREMEGQIYEFLSNRNEGQIDTMADNELVRPGRTRYGFGLGGF